MSSPYAGLGTNQWKARTEELVRAHPLTKEEIVDVTLGCWNSIFATKIGGKAQVGIHILPSPQTMGVFLHELIPLEFSDRYPGVWRREESADEKDLVHIPDPSLSVEIKTSSHRSQVFGNRSFAQPGNSTKKAKSGFYLTVNFEKFTKSGRRPDIRAIRFGWLDDTDWKAQKAATGQQASLPSDVYDGKLLLIHQA